jgi:hypothetical protein
MIPANAIASIDRLLAATGEDIVVRRITDGVNTDVGVRASVRAYSPEELVGGIIQGDSQVICSPTEMTAASWPLPPRANDKTVIQGKVRNVTAATPIYMNGTLVRIEMTVRG